MHINAVYTSMCVSDMLLVSDSMFLYCVLFIFYLLQPGPLFLYIIAFVHSAIQLIDANVLLIIMKCIYIIYGYSYLCIYYIFSRICNI